MAPFQAARRDGRPVQRSSTTTAWAPSRVVEQVDLVAYAALVEPLGISARDAARAIKDGKEPTAAETERARRRLDRLTKDGHLCLVKGHGYPGSPDVWRPNLDPVDTLWITLTHPIRP